MSHEQSDLSFDDSSLTDAADSPTTKKVPRKRAAKKAARKRVAKKAAADESSGSGDKAAISVPKPPPVTEDVPQSFSTDDDDLRDKPKPAERDSGNNNDRADDSRRPDDSARPSSDDSRGQRKPQRGRDFKQKPYKPGGFKKGQNQPNQQNQQQQKKGQGQGQGQRQQKQRRGGRDNDRRQRKPQRDSSAAAEWGDLPGLEVFRSLDKLGELAAAITDAQQEPLYLDNLLHQPFLELRDWAQKEYDLPDRGQTARQSLIEAILDAAMGRGQPVHCRGIIDIMDDGHGLIVYQSDNYQIRPASAFLPRLLLKKFAIKPGTVIEAQLHPRRKPLPEDALDKLKSAGRDEAANDAIPDDVEEDLASEALAALFPENDYVQDIDADDETCPYVVKVVSLMGKSPEENLEVTPFEDLIPYYPTERIILETEPKVKWDNTAMRVVDLLTPVGLGQRGLIVAPPRTGKTILQQGVANAVAVNKEDAHLIVLLIDERPEEVTDFRRQITSGEVIASTFDETPENHVHCAEMVIEKARRMVENGQHVIILLDSITRLARAYNALAANSGKILSGGVEANALQKPKRFFGSARNIEGGGSLTILGTALVETGSRMDEVIFEEFKGTGNMELHLDRALSDKRIFPAIEMNKSGTRKEELLYHPEEMQKVYGLRRAMKGVPPTDAMEMLITRIKKTTTNIQFLMGVNT